MTSPAANQYVERYEYVRRPASMPGVPAAHAVTIGAEIPDGFGGTTVVFQGPMPLDEAAAKGWTADRIHDAINGDTASALDATQGELAEARTQIAELEAALAEATMVSDRAKADLAKSEAARTALAGRLTEAVATGERTTRDLVKAEAELGLLTARMAVGASPLVPILGPDGAPLAGR